MSLMTPKLYQENDIRRLQRTSATTTTSTSASASEASTEPREAPPAASCASAGQAAGPAKQKKNRETLETDIGDRHLARIPTSMKNVTRKVTINKRGHAQDCAPGKIDTFPGGDDERGGVINGDGLFDWLDGYGDAVEHVPSREMAPYPSILRVGSTKAA